MHDICSFVIFLTSGTVKYAKYESTINYTRPLLFTTINSVNIITIKKSESFHIININEKRLFWSFLFHESGMWTAKSQKMDLLDIILLDYIDLSMIITHE